MTDLNISLWVVGIAVIIGVIIYNFWQEYKAKKNVERAFGQHQDDVLMRSTDSTLNLAPYSISRDASGTDGAGGETPRREPSLDDQDIKLESFTPGADTTVTPEAGYLPVDDFIDCVISMEFEFPTSGEKILSEVQSFRLVGNKPVHFIGTNKDGKREIITHTTSYTHLSAGVQLVTRSGALNELEYSELVTKLRQIADNLNAWPDIPDMKDVIAAAHELHLFVTEHDAQLSVNVKTTGSPWGISTLLAALEKHGFDSQPDGRLAMSDGEGGALFTLSTNCGVSEQTTNHLTLLLDVPCVSPSRNGFGAMVSCAKVLGLRLGGKLVDDGNQLLTEATLNQIQQQVDAFYSEMQEAGIPAGSTRAVRIFS